MISEAGDDVAVAGMLAQHLRNVAYQHVCNADADLVLDVLEVVDQYIDNLNKFRALIEEKNEAELKRIMTETNVIRKVLKKETEKDKIK